MVERRGQSGEALQSAVRNAIGSSIELVISKATTARLAEPGSGAALLAAQEAVCVLMDILSPALGSIASDQGTSRGNWLEALRFLASANVFPAQTRSLAVALAEVDRGIVSAELGGDGKAQGGKTGTSELFWQSVANEALEELAKIEGGITKAIGEVEESLNVPEGTIKKWRQRVRKEAPLEWRASPINLSLRLLWRRAISGEFDGSAKETSKAKKASVLDAFKAAYEQATGRGYDFVGKSHLDQS